MAGISVTLEGDNIQLAFQKGDQATAVVMDPQAARSLVKAVGQLLSAIGEGSGEVGGDTIGGGGGGGAAGGFSPPAERAAARVGTIRLRRWWSSRRPPLMWAWTRTARP